MNDNDTINEEPGDLLSLPDFDDLDHSIVDAFDDNLFKYLRLHPTWNATQVETSVVEFLNDIWNETLESPDIDSETRVIDIYVQILETIIIKLMQDLNVVLKACVPHQIESQFAQANITGNRYLIEKLVFNLLFPLETSGYDYPQGPPYDDPAKFGYLVSGGDAAWRGTSDHDHEATLKLMPLLPYTWQSTVKAYLERTASYVYGGAEFDEDHQEESSGIVNAPCM